MCRREAPMNGSRKTVHRVLMWAPPRSLSTCVERSFICHPEIHVQHEPFGTPFYWSEDAQSGREASGGLRKPTYATVADDVLLSRPPPGKQYIFSKNLSYYVSPHCIEQLADWEAQAVSAGDTVVHCFMMRHPAKAISSLYYKSCIDNEGTGYTHFDAVEAGYEQMWDILRYIDQTGAKCAIIDADDLLEDPKGVMEAFSSAVGLPFSESMLSWPAGPVKGEPARRCDTLRRSGRKRTPTLPHRRARATHAARGPHAPSPRACWRVRAELESPFSGWTDDVQKSTGIKRREKRSPPPSVLTLPDNVQECIARAMAVYKKMSPRRLRAGGVVGDLPHEVADAAGGEKKKADAERSTINPLGIALVLVAVVLWVFNAEMLQRTYTPSWDKPYCAGLMLKGSWSIMMLMWLLASRWQRMFEDEITFRKPLKVSRSTVLLSLGVMLLVQAASVTWIASLPRTPVSANTAIYQINPLLVYAFSIPLLGERVSKYKLAAVVLAVCGVWLVAMGRQDETDGADAGVAAAEDASRHDSWGYVLVTVSTTIFSLKEVLFKRLF
eukprot:7384486-Prymnesium_polylepis.1